MAEVQLRLRFLPIEVGKSLFVGKNLVTAQTLLCLYSEQ